MPGLISFDTALDRHDCAASSQCRHTVRELLETNTRLKLAEPAAGTEAWRSGLHALAVLDLDAYADFSVVMEAARTVSEKRGRANREIDRAKRAGYYVKQFPVRQHAPDLIDIHRSRPPRPGNLDDLELQKKGVAQFGGVPTERVEIEPHGCPQHHGAYWGVFQREDGHCQGDVQTDERLVGYIYLIRAGNSAWYNGIMGHAHHLRQGIMYLLHYHLVEAMIRQRPERLRYLVFYQYARRPDDDATNWKRLALFTPYYLMLADAQRMRMPADMPMPDFAEGLFLLKQCSELGPSEAVNLARQAGIAPEWLEFLQQAWLVQETRAPALLSRLLRAGATPPLEILRPLVLGLFPIEVLGTIDTVVVILSDQGRGLDTLLPLHDRGLKNVTVYHPERAEIEALQATYDEGWQYVHLPDDNAPLTAPCQAAGLLIIEPPLHQGAEFLRMRIGPLLFNCRVLVSVDEAFLVILGCETLDIEKLSQRFSWFFSRSLRCTGVYFRHGCPTLVYWICLDQDT